MIVVVVIIDIVGGPGGGFGGPGGAFRGPGGGLFSLSSSSGLPLLLLPLKSPPGPPKPPPGRTTNATTRSTPVLVINLPVRLLTVVE